jgi:hypothetical protein
MTDMGIVVIRRRPFTIIITIADHEADVLPVKFDGSSFGQAVLGLDLGCHVPQGRRRVRELDGRGAEIDRSMCRVSKELRDSRIGHVSTLTRETSLADQTARAA